jgi:hypothetical protein
VSVKTPVFKFDTPVLGEEANVPQDLGDVILEVENVVKALEPKFIKTAGAGDVKKLLIVDNTGAPIWRALSGDATIAEAGALTIANEAVNAAKLLNLAVTEAKLAGESVATAKIKLLAVTAATLAAEAVETAKIKGEAVTEAKLANLAVATGKIANLAVTAGKLAEEAVETAKIKNLAVTEAKLAELAVTEGKIANLAVSEAKLADKAVTSRKFKPTAGLKVCSADLALTEAYQDIAFTGGNLVITPAVASTLMMWVQIGFGSHTGDTESFRILMDAEERALGEFVEVTESVNRAPMMLVDAIPLTAAEHTIKLQAKQVPSHADKVWANITRYTYMLVAS